MRMKGAGLHPAVPAVPVFALAARAQCPAPPPLEEILSRLADSQERAVEARRTIVYQQNALVRLWRAYGRLAREERRTCPVTPAPAGTEKKLERFEGRYENRGQLLPCTSPGFNRGDFDLDGALIQSLTDEWLNGRWSRDGIASDLFPLTRREQRGCRFMFEGCRTVAGRPAFLLRFQPRGKDGGESKPWAGDVFVDPEEYQPRVVSTKLAWNVPAAVRILFGTNIRQLGFHVTFQKAGHGLWFPSACGTEFSLRVLYGYRRNIPLNAVHSDFRRTDAESTVSFLEGIVDP